MKLERQNDTLHVSDFDQLDATNALAFRATVAAALDPSITQVKIDFARAEFVDCGGLGALVALRKTLRHFQPQATLSLLHLAPSAQRLLQLTRTQRLFLMPSVESTVLPMPGLNNLEAVPDPAAAVLDKDTPEEPLSAVA